MAVDPFNQHFTFYRGEDVHVLLQLTPKADASAWTFGFWLKTSLDDADADAVLDATDIEIDASADGLIDLDIGSEDTLQSAQTYYFALWRVTAGSKANLASGTIMLSKSARKGA